jgi:hypothetical protein
MSEPDELPDELIVRGDVACFTFREYRKIVRTRISDEVLPAGTRVQTLEGESVCTQPSRLAVDVAGNIYLVEESMFVRSYVQCVPPPLR